MSDRNDDPQPLFSWPDSSLRWRITLATIWLSGLFAVVYGGADYLTSLRADQYVVGFAWEESIPLVPEFILVYSSVYLMFVVVALSLDDESELQRFVVRMTVLTVAAGAVFLLVPSKLTFQPEAVTGWIAAPFRWADYANLTYNCLPSLHVAYAVFCGRFMHQKRRWLGWLGNAWALAVAVSAWLTHQHHLLDLIFGCLFGLGAHAIPVSRPGGVPRGRPQSDRD